MSVVDVYLRFTNEAEAKSATGALFVADPVISKEIAVSIARERLTKAVYEYEVKKTPYVKGVALEPVRGREVAIGEETELAKPVFFVDAKAEITPEDLTIKVEDAELKPDWAPESLPPDGKVLGYQFDIVPVGVVYDAGPEDKETGLPTAVARTGYHVLARFRGKEDIPASIRSYETTPWNQVLG